MTLAARLAGRKGVAGDGLASVRSHGAPLSFHAPRLRQALAGLAPARSEPLDA
jgi:hypothetical protein